MSQNKFSMKWLATDWKTETYNVVVKPIDGRNEIPAKNLLEASHTYTKLLQGSTGALISG